MVAQITPFPSDMPLRSQPAFFSPRMESCLTHFATFINGANAVSIEVNDNATLADDARTEAVQAATTAVSTTGSVKWVSGTTYAIGDCVWSPTNYLVYRRKTAGAGTTDPMSDPTNWQQLVQTEMVRDQRTANTALGRSDERKLIDITSGTFAQTFAGCATLGSGWACLIRNSGTGAITLTPGSGTIAGQAALYLAQGDTVIVQCDGANLHAIRLTAESGVCCAAGVAAPTGYLPCDLSNYLVSAYPGLAKVAINNPLFGVAPRFTPASNYILDDALYAGGLYMVCGQTGTLYTSTDLATWTARTSQFGTRSIKALAYGGGLFVAVGGESTSGNAISTSTDGTTWTSRVTAAVQYIDVAYGAGVFVALAADGSIMSSPDGITWTARTSNLASGGSPIGVIFEEGIFVAVGGAASANSISSSPDGITWTARVTVATNTPAGLSYGDGVFVVPYSAGAVKYSGDGITWADGSTVAALSKAVAYGNGVFVVGISTGAVVSPDGITFTTVTGAPIATRLIFGGGMFVASGTGGTWCSRDGVSWNRIYLETESQYVSTVKATTKLLSANDVPMVQYSATPRSVCTPIIASDTSFSVPYLANTYIKA